jgi:hypothetical protein
MKKALFVLLLACSSHAFADDAGLQNCRAISDWFKRLACYDALPVTGSPAPAQPGVAGKAPAAAAGSTAAPAATAAAAAPASPQQQFGLEERPKPAAEVVQTIVSTIPGHFEGWKPRTLIELANGQIWRITDDSTRYMDLDNPRVTIRRGMLGSFFMDFDGDNRSPRVQRVK